MKTAEGRQNLTSPSVIVTFFLRPPRHKFPSDPPRAPIECHVFTAVECRNTVTNSYQFWLLNCNRHEKISSDRLGPRDRCTPYAASRVFPSILMFLFLIYHKFFFAGQPHGQVHAKTLSNENVRTWRRAHGIYFGVSGFSSSVTDPLSVEQTNDATRGCSMSGGRSPPLPAASPTHRHSHARTHTRTDTPRSRRRETHTHTHTHRTESFGTPPYCSPKSFPSTAAAAFSLLIVEPSRRVRIVRVPVLWVLPGVSFCYFFVSRVFFARPGVKRVVTGSTSPQSICQPSSRPSNVQLATADANQSYAVPRLVVRLVSVCMTWWCSIHYLSRITYNVLSNKYYINFLYIRIYT